MEFIKEYKGFKIWKGEQYNYTGYLVTMKNHETLRDMIRAGNTLKETYGAINRLETV
jgi:hypothetical protein